MNWYQVLTSVQEYNEPLVDLSTGNPLVVEEISQVISECLRTIAERPRIIEISGYASLDGLPELLDEFAATCFQFSGYKLEHQRMLVVPGVQSALRYAHEILRNEPVSGRLLFPICLEFPGAVDPCAREWPAVGCYETEITQDHLFRPVIDQSSLNWEGVSAVVLSRPHSPTGCVWSISEVMQLADAAARNGAWLILDETYALPFAPMMEETYSFVDHPNIVHLYSFSKVGLAGERIGIVVAEPAIIARFRDALRRNIIQAPKTGQYLALAIIQAIRREPGLGKRFGALYRERWELCRRLLSSHMTLGKVASWQGGPFLWYQWFGEPNSDDLFYSLLQKGVAVAPGSALWISRSTVEEKPEAIRIGLGTDLDILEKAILVVNNLMNELSLARFDGVAKLG